MAHVHLENFLARCEIAVHHFHHALHLRIHAALADDQRRNAVDQALRLDDIFDPITENLLAAGQNILRFASLERILLISYNFV